MNCFVARENIKNFRRMLEEATEPLERAGLQKLLAEEEQKLKIAEPNPGD